MAERPHPITMMLQGGVILSVISAAFVLGSRGSRIETLMEVQSKAVEKQDNDIDKLQSTVASLALTVSTVAGRQDDRSREFSSINDRLKSLEHKVERSP